MAALLHKKMLLVGILELTFIQFALSALPTFITPDIGGSTSPRAVDENAPPGNSILLVEGQDADGDNLTYSIQLQNPISPAFEINTTSGLFKTPSGLDAEFAQQYTLRFGISDGGAVQESVDFIVNINDLNDNAPVFNPSTYSNSTLDSVAIGTSLVTVIATDADVTAQFNTIAYSISSGDTNSLFTVGGSSGILTTTKVLTGQNGTYTLTVQASDGPFSDTATVTVTVEVDYCNANPCNGGSCTNTGTGIGYTCDCSGTGLGGQNCTDATTTASTTNEQRGGGGSSGGGLSAGGIAGIVIAVIVVLAIVIVLIVVYLHKRVPVCGPIIEGCLSDRTNSNDDTDKPIEKRDKMELVVTGVGDTTTTTTTTANKTQDTSRSDKYRTENENISTTNAEADEKVTKNGKLGDKQGDSVSQGQDMAKDSEHENTDADVKDNGKTKSDERERNTSDTEIPLLDKKQDEKSGIKL